MSCFGRKLELGGASKKARDHTEILRNEEETKSRRHDHHHHRRRSPAATVSARRAGDVSESTTTTTSASVPQGPSRVLPSVETDPGTSTSSAATAASTSSNNNSNNVDDTRSSSASRSEEENPSSLLLSSRSSSRLREFKYAELKYGTSNFHPQNVLGAGGFGFVYKGVIMTKKLPSLKSSSASGGGDGGGGSDYQRLEVAIKMLNKDSLQVLRKYKEIRSCACLVVFCTVFVDCFFYLGNY
jgi:hypothetical protein